MPLPPSTKLGPYEIVSTIGAGGMGVVYKANDTRLDRIVAIKVSKAEFSSRFAQEARTISALNHPHICHLYDVGPNYLVMEFVDGAPLKGPLPLDLALKYAAQICDALDAAHKKGITHRDLKPQNILLAKDGVKLLDFGLALITGRDQTVTMPGAAMGTPGYASPEQWEGKPGDARSDIYALGCVLYEMLTGKRASREWVPVEPPALQRLIDTCLENDPDDRWQSARDVRSALALTRAHTMQTIPPAANSWRERAAWTAAAVLAIICAIALRFPWHAAPSIQQPLVKLDLDLGAPVFGSNIGADSILSPDGTRLVFVSAGLDEKSRLSVRRLDQAKATELPGTENAYGPFFSPNGLSVGFFASGKLKKINLDGGDSVILCDAPAGRGATWSEDGNIVAALDVVRGLDMIPSAEGSPLPSRKSNRVSPDIACHTHCPAARPCSSRSAT